MKKLLFKSGTILVRLCAIVAVLGLTCLFSPSAHAQATSYLLSFNGLPSGEGGVDLQTYIGLDRKLKTNVSGQTLSITISPPLTTPKKVYLSIVVAASGSLVACNKVIATATTVAFDVSGGGRTLGSSVFTGSGIGIQDSYTEQPCIDALSDELTKGVPAIPNGIYTISATLFDNATKKQLGPSGSSTITISAKSLAEAQLNLTSPLNGEQVSYSPKISFIFDHSVPTELLVFQHSTLGQSPDDATRDDNSPLKVVDVNVSGHGSDQVNATPAWQIGKKYSWYLRSTVTSGGSTEIKKSPIWSFVVVSSDPNYTRLVGALQSAPDPVGSTFSNMTSSGFILNLNGQFYLQEGDNGAPQPKTLEQILSLLASLAQKNVQLKVGVTQ